MENKKENGFTIVSDKAIKELGLSKAYFLSRLLRFKEYKGKTSFQASDEYLSGLFMIPQRTIRFYKKELNNLDYIKIINTDDKGMNIPCVYEFNSSKINELLGYDKLEVVDNDISSEVKPNSETTTCTHETKQHRTLKEMDNLTLEERREINRRNRS